MSGAKKVTRDYLHSLIQICQFTHVYYCPAGMHFGVIVMPTRFCPMGCNGG